MKLIDGNFDYKKRLNEKIWCVECVTNDAEEYSIEIYECNSKEEAKIQAYYSNSLNKNKKYKYIVIEYTVCEDYLQA